MQINHHILSSICLLVLSGCRTGPAPHPESVWKSAAPQVPASNAVTTNDLHPAPVALQLQDNTDKLLAQSEEYRDLTSELKVRTRDPSNRYVELRMKPEANGEQRDDSVLHVATSISLEGSGDTDSLVTPASDVQISTPSRAPRLISSAQLQHAAPVSLTIEQSLLEEPASIPSQPSSQLVPHRSHQKPPTKPARTKRVIASSTCDGVCF